MKILEIIILYITIYCMTCILLNCYNNLTDYTLSLKQNNLLKIKIAFFSILFELNNLLNFTEYKVIVSFIIMFILYIFCFKNSFKETLINTIIIVILATLIELLCSLVMLINSSVTINFNNVIMKVLLSVIVFKFTDWILTKEKVLSIINKIKKFAQERYFFEFTLLLLIFVIDILLFFRSKNFNNIYNICSIFILTIYIIFTLTQIIRSKYIIEKLEAKNTELTNLYKASSAAMEQFRELKHNLKNDLYSIKGILPKEKQILLTNIMNKYNTNYEWLNNVTDIPEGLQGIIYLKKIEAEKQKVKLNVNYNSKKEIKEKDFLDICDALGIYIDNAIEASKEIGEKIIVLDIRDYNDSMILKVINKFSNNVNLNEIGNKDYSTKNRNSGVGLNYISKIKNKNIKNKISIVNNLFIASIEYKIK